MEGGLAFRIRKSRSGIRTEKEKKKKVHFPSFALFLRERNVCALAFPLRIGFFLPRSRTEKVIVVVFFVFLFLGKWGGGLGDNEINARCVQGYVNM